jgi:hypothetical protein
MTVPVRDSNPGGEYPPTRPGWRTLLVVLAALVVGLAIMSWSQISHDIHLAGIGISRGL